MNEEVEGPTIIVIVQPLQRAVTVTFYEVRAALITFFQLLEPAPSLCVAPTLVHHTRLSFQLCGSRCCLFCGNLIPIGSHLRILSASPKDSEKEPIWRFPIAPQGENFATDDIICGYTDIYH